MLKTLALRALRGFIAGGVANVVAVLAANQFNIHSLADLRNLGFALATAFIIGALLALDKLARWQDEPSQ